MFSETVLVTKSSNLKQILLWPCGQTEANYGQEAACFTERPPARLSCRNGSRTRERESEVET